MRHSLSPGTRKGETEVSLEKITYHYPLYLSVLNDFKMSVTCFSVVASGLLENVASNEIRQLLRANVSQNIGLATESVSLANLMGGVSVR